MKKRYFLLVLTALFLSGFLISGTVFAAEVKLSDSANLLSAEEASYIEQQMDYILDRHDVSVSIITSDKIAKKDMKSYFKSQKESSADENLVIVFVSVKKKELFCRIAVYGKAKTDLTGNRLHQIEKTAEKGLSGGDYYEVLNRICSSLLEQMGTRPVSDLFIFRPVFQLILCFLLTAGAMFLLLHRFDNKEVQAVPYYNEKYSTLLGSLDHFSHTSAKTIKKKRAKGKKKGGKKNEDSEDEDEFEF